ncbi:MAG: hypothetical protein LLG08_04050 [Actinomycetia bacterium]|nr:hypothetical protein [Actinomycetes bacterium]
MPYARLVELLECAQLEDQRDDMRAAMASGNLPYDKYREQVDRLTRAKVELDEEALEHVGERAGELARAGKMRRKEL